MSNKLGWTKKHRKTHRDIAEINAKIRDIHAERDSLNTKFQEKIISLRNKRKKIEDDCNHIDDGGFLVAGCKVCGWKDFYDG